MSRVITSLQLIHHALRPHKTQQHGRPQRKSSDRRIPPSHPSLSLFLLSLSLSHPSLLSLFHSVLPVFLLSLSLSLSHFSAFSRSLSLSLCVYISVCVCVCVCARARARARACVCVCVCVLPAGKGVGLGCLF